MRYNNNNKQCEKVILSENANLQPLNYWSTALPLELERMTPRMFNFGYSNPVHDVDNNLIVMF